MRFTYKKLWKLLIDKEINKKTFCQMSDISPTSVAKLGNDGNVNNSVLLKICTALHCDIGDIMEIVPDDTAEPSAENDKSVIRDNADSRIEPKTQRWE
jgi:DNA-binding Xre family transcriptional regulator